MIWQNKTASRTGNLYEIVSSNASFCPSKGCNSLGLIQMNFELIFKKNPENIYKTNKNPTHKKEFYCIMIRALFFSSLNVSTSMTKKGYSPTVQTNFGHGRAKRHRTITVTCFQKAIKSRCSNDCKIRNDT